MEQDTLNQHENAFYHAVKDGPVTAAEIRKSTKLDEEDVEAFIAYWRERLYLEVDNTGKTEKFSITQLGRNDMRATYNA